MQEQVSAIPYLRAYAEAQQLPFNGDMLEDSIYLAQKPDPFGPRRSVEIETHSDGSITATSYKAYNLLRLSQIKFQLSVLNLLPAAAALVPGNPALTNVLALGSFIAAFVGTAKVEFREQDARVLLCIYKLGSYCHLSTIPDIHRRLFREDISAEAILASIRVLESYRTVRCRNEEVEIKEHVELTRP